jgi:hypothetical protein
MKYFIGIIQNGVFFFQHDRYALLQKNIPFNFVRAGVSVDE